MAVDREFQSPMSVRIFIEALDIFSCDIGLIR
jgi:hypothetical protein